MMQLSMPTSMASPASSDQSWLMASSIEPSRYDGAVAPGYLRERAARGSAEEPQEGRGACQRFALAHPPVRDGASAHEAPPVPACTSAVDEHGPSCYPRGRPSEPALPRPMRCARTIGGV